MVNAEVKAMEVEAVALETAAVAAAVAAAEEDAAGEAAESQHVLNDKCGGDHGRAMNSGHFEMWMAMYTTILMVAFTMFLLFAFGIIIYKRFIQRKAVSVSYTPFDYITGQKSKEFHNDHEENEESTQ